MKRKRVVPPATIFAVLCLAGMDFCTAEVNQASEGPPPERLYVQLLGTSQ
jgi:hypothetical protein